MVAAREVMYTVVTTTICFSGLSSDPTVACFYDMHLYDAKSTDALSPKVAR